MCDNALPVIIQGGMGVAVSNWRLANAVSSRGQLGVVSGTALDTVFVRRLQDGDVGGHMRRQLTMLANFVEVYLAKENHGNAVGSRVSGSPTCRHGFPYCRNSADLVA